jgi:hypothetical protein
MLISTYEWRAFLSGAVSPPATPTEPRSGNEFVDEPDYDDGAQN